MASKSTRKFKSEGISVTTYGTMLLSRYKIKLKYFRKANKSKASYRLVLNSHKYPVTLAIHFIAIINLIKWYVIGSESGTNIIKL
jgi:hypothetical protein